MSIRKRSGCQWLLATVAMVGMSLPSALSAQSQSGGGSRRAGRHRTGLTEPHVDRTHFKTVNGVFLTLNAAWVNAFTDTVVSCPGTPRARLRCRSRRNSGR